MVMILATFALTGMALIMIQIAVQDARISYAQTKQDIAAAFGHDTKIFPDL